MPNRALSCLPTPLLFAMALFIGCASRGATKQSLEAKIKSKLGTGYTVSYNEPKTYALYQQSRVNDHANRSFKYLVVNLSDSKIISEGSFRNGYVKWIDNNSIEIGSATKGELVQKRVIKVNNQKS